MTRQDIVLAALAANDGSFTPVQVQKLLFLLDRKLPIEVEGPRFNFTPYDYGPFDKAVYDELGNLRGKGLVVIQEGNRPLRTYSLTPEGRKQGEATLAQLPGGYGEYVRSLAAWVRRVPFSTLISAVYHAYPEMKVNSVFRDKK